MYFRGLFKALKASQLEFSLYLHKSHYRSKKKSTEELQAALKMFLQNRKADLTWIKNSALFQSCKSSFIHQRTVKASHFWHSIGQRSVTKRSGMHWAAIQLVVVYDFSVWSIAGSAGGGREAFSFHQLLSNSVLVPQTPPSTTEGSLGCLSQKTEPEEPAQSEFLVEPGSVLLSTAVQDAARWESWEE